MDYKGIKIYNKILIVEKTETTEGSYNWRGRTVNQGYIIDKKTRRCLNKNIFFFNYFDLKQLFIV